MFTRLVGITLVSCVIFSSPTLTQSLTLDSFQTHCAEKTLVYGRDAKGDVIKTGEQFDGYCAGYLEGALATMQHAKLACPDFAKSRIDVGFLLSVVDTYVKDKGLSNIDAGQAIEEAYLRAFPCKQ
jgi:hypothetical protein